MQPDVPAAQTAPRVEIAQPIDILGRLRASLGQRLHQMTLLRRLLLLEAIVILVLVGVSVVILNRMTNELEGQIKHERLVLAQSIRDELDDEISSTSHEMALVSATFQNKASDEDARQSALDYLYQDNWQTTNLGVYLVDAQGSILMADSSHHDATQARIPGSLFPNEPVYRSQIDATQTWMMRDTAGKPLLAMAVPVSASGIDDSRPRYVVGVIDPAVTKLTEDLGLTVTLGRTGHAAVVDAKGLTILSTEDDVSAPSEHQDFYVAMMSRHQPSVGTTGSRAIVSQQGTIAAGQKDMDTQDHVMAFAPLASMPWGVGVGGTVGETFAPVHRLERWIILILGGLIGVGVVGTVFGARKLVEPVLELQSTAQRVAAGDLDPPIRVAVGGEIGKMAESLEAMRAKLQGWGLELEERVAQRTAELERRNRELATTSAVAEAVASSLSPESIFDKASSHILAMPGIDGIVFYLLVGNDTSNGLRPYLSRGVPKDLVTSANGLGCAACLGEAVIQSGHLTQAEMKDSALESPPPCLAHGFSAVVSVPLLSANRAVGAMCVLSREGGLAESDLQILRMIGYQIGEGIETSLLYSKIQEQEHHLRLLLEQVLSAQEDERQRVARELHDETGQALAAISMGLDSLEKSAGRSRHRERLQELRRFSSDALSDLKRMVAALRPPVLDDMGLVAAVRRYSDQHLARNGTEVKLRSENLQERLDPHIEVVVFRIVQEAINNISRHSRATQASIELTRAEDSISGLIRDDGQGFDLERLLHERGGSAALGILGMQERASLVGGELAVQSNPGAGTQVRFQIPLPQGGVGHVSS